MRVGAGEPLLVEGSDEVVVVRGQRLRKGVEIEVTASVLKHLKQE